MKEVKAIPEFNMFNVLRSLRKQLCTRYASIDAIIIQVAESEVITLIPINIYPSKYLINLD